MRWTIDEEIMNLSDSEADAAADRGKCDLSRPEEEEGKRLAAHHGRPCGDRCGLKFMITAQAWRESKSRQF